MSSIRPADEQHWGRPLPADHLGPPPGGDGWAGPGGPSPCGGRLPDRRLPIVVGVAIVIVALVAGLLLRSGSDSDDNGTEQAGVDAAEGIGTALAPAASAPANQGTLATTSTGPDGSGSDGGDGSGDDNAAPSHPELPAVTIPGDSSPPTTIPGSQPSSVPGADGDLPLFAHIVVDLQPNGFQDFAVFLRQDQKFQLLSLADDGVETDIEVFAPDGSSEGGWRGGEPGVVNGLEWHADERLPATGTYVIRVVHTGGSDAPFALGFFGDR
jgi:hypothetical protein